MSLGREFGKDPPLWQGKHSGEPGKDGIMRREGKSAVGVGTVAPPAPLLVEPERGLVMDRLREFLDVVREQGHATGNFLGLLHILIGRRIATADGEEVSLGLTWRDLSTLLKKVRWDREAVRELGLDPDNLSPRDRQRYWYQAIAQAGVDSSTAKAAGDRLAQAVASSGYVIGPAPGST
jgi:hypothetical protein